MKRILLLLLLPVAGLRAELVLAWNARLVSVRPGARKAVECLQGALVV